MIFVVIAIIVFFIFFQDKSFVPSEIIATRVFEKWYETVVTIADSWNIRRELVLAVIAVESGGNENANGAAGEKGLMQLTPDGLKDANAQAGTSFLFDSMYNPQWNIVAGCALLTFNKVRLGNDIGKAVQAYNAGLKNVQQDSSAGIVYRNKVALYQNLFTTIS